MQRIKQRSTDMIVDVAGNPAAFCLRAGVERRTVPNEVVKHSDQFGRDRDIVAVEEALALARVHQPQRWRFARSGDEQGKAIRSAEHTSALQSLMRLSYAVVCLKTKTQT